LIAAAIAVGVSLAAPAVAEEDSAKPKIVRQGEAASGYIVVTAEKTDIYAAPADAAASIGSAAKGDAFPLAGRQEGWYFVATGPATHGWIRSTAAATVFYPEYFQPPRPPDYSSPPTPDYPEYPPYAGPWMYRGYGPGWRDRDAWDLGRGALWWGLWLRSRRDRWDDDWGRGPGRDRDWRRDRDWNRDRDWDRDRWRDRDWR